MTAAAVRAAFSTLGCPGLPLASVAAIAAREGFSGVELRAADGEPVRTDLDAAGRLAARTTLESAAVTPLSVASYVRVVGPPGPDAGPDMAGDAAAHGRLAADVGARFLRVFPGGASTGTDTDPGTDGTGPDAAARRLRAIRDAVPRGVTVALETHDSRPRGADVARLLDRCPGVTAIWDVLHTWRSGETPRQSLSALQGRLAYVQIKDVASASDLTPLAPGDGALPLEEVADALRHTGYRGWVSWEYERAWFPQRPGLDVLAGRAAAWIRTHLD